MRYFRMLAVVALLLVSASAEALPLCSWPSYENTTRHWGRVVNVWTSTVSGQPWVAFSLRDWSAADVLTPTGASVRVECGTAAVSLGCDQITIGDSILLSGHLEEYASCRVSGPDDYSVPNVLWRCIDHVPGSCLQLTPCS